MAKQLLGGHRLKREIRVFADFVVRLQRVIVLYVTRCISLARIPFCFVLFPHPFSRAIHRTVNLVRAYIRVLHNRPLCASLHARARSSTVEKSILGFSPPRNRQGNKSCLSNSGNSSKDTLLLFFLPSVSTPFALVALKNWSNETNWKKRKDRIVRLVLISSIRCYQIVSWKKIPISRLNSDYNRGIRLSITSVCPLMAKN